MTFEAFPDRRPPQRLPIRAPQAAPSDLVPEQPAEPALAHLLDAPASEAVDSRLDPARLQCLQVAELPESAT